MTKSILAYGFDLPNVDGFEPVSLTSERSMLDADVIAVELSLDGFRTSGFHEGLPNLTEHSSAKFRETIVRWHSHMETALNSGKTVVIFLTKVKNAFYYTGEKENVGTPGRPRMEVIVSPCSNYDFIPVQLADMSVSNGSSFKIMKEGADLLDQYWTNFGLFSSYRCYFKSDAGWRPLLATKGGEHDVAASVRVGKGTLLLLPEVDWSHLPQPVNTSGGFDKFDDDDGDYVTWPEEYKQFTFRLRDSLLSLDRRLRAVGERSDAPDWVASPVYRMSSESSLELEMLGITEQIASLSSKYTAMSLQLDAEGELRSLLYETGPRLEAAVREALKVLKFDVYHFESEDSEFDAIFSSYEGRFIGEVEGRDSKAIDVKKASQLHRNLSEHYARDDVDQMATGVLFGNAFRLTCPIDRESSFTPKVITFAETVKLVLVRTPDLFAAARHVKNTGDEVFAKLCRQAIADGRGAIVQFPATPCDPNTEISQLGQSEDCSQSNSEVV